MKKRKQIVGDYSYSRSETELDCMTRGFLVDWLHPLIHKTEANLETLKNLKFAIRIYTYQEDDI